MSAAIAGTEGMIGMMNLITNSHINKYHNADPTKPIYVNTIVSPLFNTDTGSALIDSVLL